MQGRAVLQPGSLGDLVLNGRKQRVLEEGTASTFSSDSTSLQYPLFQYKNFVLDNLCPQTFCNNVLQRGWPVLRRVGRPRERPTGSAVRVRRLFLPACRLGSAAH